MLLNILIAQIPAVWDVAQAWKVRVLGRDGRRVHGTVVRIERDPGGRSLVSPVISYPDEYGTRHEFTVGLKAFRALHRVGADVPVRYLPGRPDTAALVSGRHTLLTFGVPVLIGVMSLAAGVWSIE